MLEIPVTIPEGIIPSVFKTQVELLHGINEIHMPEKNILDLDPTYSTGVIYRAERGIPAPFYPIFKSDIEPQLPDVIKANCVALPFRNEVFKSILFDPPFLVHNEHKNKNTGNIKKRFGYMRSHKELYSLYYNSLKEFKRVLQDKGIIIFKCQNFTDNVTFDSETMIVGMCSMLNLYVKDKAQTIRGKMTRGYKQKHFRKYHVTFYIIVKGMTKGFFKLPYHNIESYIRNVCEIKD
jgi:hypothetical protein